MLVSELVIIGVLLVDNCFVKVTDTLYSVNGSFGWTPAHPIIVAGVLRITGPTVVRPSTFASIDPSTDRRPLKVKVTFPVFREDHSKLILFPIILSGIIVVGDPLLAVIEVHVWISLVNIALRESVFIYGKFWEAGVSNQDENAGCSLKFVNSKFWGALLIICIL